MKFCFCYFSYLELSIVSNCYAFLGRIAFCVCVLNTFYCIQNEYDSKLLNKRNLCTINLTEKVPSVLLFSNRGMHCK